MLEAMTEIHHINGSALPWRVSGRLCLDFVNTVEPRDGIAPNQRSPHADKLERREYLRTYQDLVAWGIHAQTLSPATAQHLIDAAEQQPEAAQAAFERALNLRETIYRLFWMIAQGQAPASGDMSTLFHAVADMAPHVQLIAHADHLDWQWQAGEALDQMIWPVLSDAVALLVQGDPHRIKVCPGVPEEPVCAWLFYDASKNRSRQWCSMEDCGNAAKARRQTARRRALRREQKQTSPLDE
jgi:predicted RNA-binding Zn ribbon-like protein